MGTLVETVTIEIPHRCESEYRYVQHDVIPSCFLFCAPFIQCISAVLSGPQQDNTVLDLCHDEIGLTGITTTIRISVFEFCRAIKMHVLFLQQPAVRCLSTATCCTVQPSDVVCSPCSSYCTSNRDIDISVPTDILSPSVTRSVKQLRFLVCSLKYSYLHA